MVISITNIFQNVNFTGKLIKIIFLWCIINNIKKNFYTKIAIICIILLILASGCGKDRAASAADTAAALLTFDLNRMLI